MQVLMVRLELVWGARWLLATTRGEGLGRVSKRFRLRCSSSQPCLDLFDSCRLQIAQRSVFGPAPKSTVPDDEEKREENRINHHRDFAMVLRRGWSLAEVSR